MNNKLLNYLSEVPSFYQKSSCTFWDDEHISKYMLDAHLDYVNEGASRPLDVIFKTCHWIDDYCTIHDFGKKVLDLGCGPGLYTEQLYEKGYDITGIDFSKRSVEYAQEHALKTNKSIVYHYQNYLEMNYEEEFDVIIMIYCDFGVLSPLERKSLLSKVYKALKKGGIFIFDVFTFKQEEQFKEFQTIDYLDYGFWSYEKHAVIQRNIHYLKTHNTLEQYIVLLENDTRYYNIWNQCYNIQMIKKELIKQDFKCIDIFGNTAGELLNEESLTMCVVAQKKGCSLI